MGTLKRVYWYHFVFNGQHVQHSTKQGSPRVARQVEAAHRTSLAKGEAGFRTQTPMPTLGEFIRTRFEPWAWANFECSSPKTWGDWYCAHAADNCLCPIIALQARCDQRSTNRSVCGPQTSCGFAGEFGKQLPARRASDIASGC